MTNQEILEKAIQKAIDGGWNGKQYLTWMREEFFGGGGFNDYASVIFSHDFAKALWGELRDVSGYKHYLEGEYFNDPTVEEYKQLSEDDREYKSWSYYAPVFDKLGWRFHLQQMVIADDPIKYLGENL